MTTDIDMFRLL